MDADGVVIFSVVILFLPGEPRGRAVAARYPEVWLVTLALSMITVLMPFRLLLGRPHQSPSPHFYRC